MTSPKLETLSYARKVAGALGCALAQILTHTAYNDSDSLSFLGVTGGVYKAGVQFHRGVLIRDYLRFLFHAFELQTAIQTKMMVGEWLRLSPLQPIVITIVALL